MSCDLFSGCVLFWERIGTRVSEHCFSSWHPLPFLATEISCVALLRSRHRQRKQGKEGHPQETKKTLFRSTLARPVVSVSLPRFLRPFVRRPSESPS